jgi:hypothetical protein
MPCDSLGESMDRQRIPAMSLCQDHVIVIPFAFVIWKALL